MVRNKSDARKGKKKSKKCQRTKYVREAVCD